MSEQSTAGSTASLRISSAGVTFAEVSRVLGMTADFGGDVGDLITPRSPNRRRAMLWGLKTRLPREAPLSDHILRLLERLEPSAVALASLSDTVDREIFAGVFSDSGHHSETLPASTLKAMAELRLNLDLDLYPDVTEMDHGD